MAVFISLSKYQKKELARFERVCRNQREHEERNRPKAQAKNEAVESQATEGHGDGE